MFSINSFGPTAELMEMAANPFRPMRASVRRERELGIGFCGPIGAFAAAALDGRIGGHGIAPIYAVSSVGPAL
jgi:hypothetical protein